MEFHVRVTPSSSPNFAGESINISNFPQIIELVESSQSHGLQTFRKAGLSWDLHLIEKIPPLKNVKGMRRPKTKIIRMRNVKLGRTTIKLGEYKINIFDKERCVVDAFRFLSKESAMYSLKFYLKRTDEHKSDLPKLARYAKELRVDIVPYIEALT